MMHMYTIPKAAKLPSRKWYEIWWYVLTHPNPDTFQEILKDSDVRAARGFSWVVVTSVVSASISLILSILLDPTGSDIYTLFFTFAATPISAIIGLAFTGSIYHSVAKSLGGSGSWENLIYCFASFTAPFTLIGSFFSLLATPLVSSIVSRMYSTGEMIDPLALTTLYSPIFCAAALIGILIWFYVTALYVSAIDGVENIGTGKAMFTYFAPTILIVVLCLCSIFTLSNLLAPLIR